MELLHFTGKANCSGLPCKHTVSNQLPNGVKMAVDLELGVDTNVSPSLHPQVVASLEDFDDDTSGHLDQVVQAFQAAYQAIGKVHSGREAIKTDPTLTEAAQVLRVADAAERTYREAASRFDKVTKNIEAGVALLEKELTTPLETRTSHPLSQEVRGYLRELKANGKSPLDFVRQAIESGDSETVSAALGAPPYLSGLTPEMHAVLLRMHHERSNPIGAKRLRAMKGALELLGSNAPLLHNELQKAIGVPLHEVEKYRSAKARTDKAFGS